MQVNVLMQLAEAKGQAGDPKPPNSNVSPKQQASGSWRVSPAAPSVHANAAQQPVLLSHHAACRSGAAPPRPPLLAAWWPSTPYRKVHCPRQPLMLGQMGLKVQPATLTNDMNSIFNLIVAETTSRVAGARSNYTAGLQLPGNCCSHGRTAVCQRQQQPQDNACQAPGPTDGTAAGSQFEQPAFAWGRPR